MTLYLERDARKAAITAVEGVLVLYHSGGSPWPVAVPAVGILDLVSFRNL